MYEPEVDADIHSTQAQYTPCSGGEMAFMGEVCFGGSGILALTLYYILYTIYYILYTKNYILKTIYYILYTIYYILYTIYYILYTIYYILYTVYCILYTIYYILYTIAITAMPLNERLLGYTVEPIMQPLGLRGLRFRSLGFTVWGLGFGV